MDTHDSGAPALGNAPEIPHGNSLARVLLASDHKTIGLRYLWLALFSVFVGMIMSLVMRLDVAWLDARVPLLAALGATPERYAALTLLHGSLMVFMVLTAAPQAGFGSYLLPVQIGAQELAFPKLSGIGFWATVASLLGITAAFFLQTAAGITLWVASVAVFCAASLLTALNFTVSVTDLRTKGMTLPRMPVTVWAWFINAILSLLIFSVLLAACLCLLFDRLAGTSFFSGANFVTAGDYAVAQQVSAQWQRLFWFFAQAVVYVAMLPCFGLATHLLSTFSRRPVFAQRATVLALGTVGVFGFCVWGQHLFSAGLNPYSPLGFSQLASSLGFPATILLLSWLGTLWTAKWGPKNPMSTAMLFTLGFISLFLIGGISGLILSRHDLSGAGGSIDFITGHYHLVMGVAATFAMVGALFFWFPKMFGRHLDERLGKIHFWLTITGVLCVFMPMHWLGLIVHAHTGIVPENPEALARATAFLRAVVTFATLFTAAAQTFFVANVVRSLRRSAQPARANPWRATTLEWSLPSPLRLLNFTNIPVVYRGAYEFRALDARAGSDIDDFLPQSIPESAVAPELCGTDLRGESMPSNPQPAGAG
jgi:cytochrome c oxidase subunit 1